MFKGIDPSIIFLIAGILMIVAIAKKAIKIGIVILIIAIIISVFGPKSEDGQELSYSNIYNNVEYVIEI